MSEPTYYLSCVAETMREIQRDCEQDASTVDSTPFTGKGVGETFGNVLALLSVLARGVELLAEGKLAEGKLAEGKEA